MAELEDLIGRIAGSGLDRSLPLWEMHLCEGLADGRMAVVAKLHHALADGVAANALLANVTDQAVAGAAAGRRPGARRRAETTLVREALVDAVRQLGTVPGLLWRTARAVATLVRHKRGVVGLHAAADPRHPAGVVQRGDDRAPGLRDLFASARRDQGGAAGAAASASTMSCSPSSRGALRAWLDARGEHPSGPLIAGVPVGTDSGGARAPGRQPGLEPVHVAGALTSPTRWNGCTRSRG